MSDEKHEPEARWKIRIEYEEHGDCGPISIGRRGDMVYGDLAPKPIDAIVGDFARMLRVLLDSGVIDTPAKPESVIEAFGNILIGRMRPHDCVKVKIVDIMDDDD